jgi:hypothetical protein
MVSALLVATIIVLLVVLRAEHRKVRELRRSIKKQGRRFLS